MAPEVFSSQVFSDDDREIVERFIQYIARGIINEDVTMRGNHLSP